MTTTVVELVPSGRLEAVPANPASAATRLARGEQHLATAAALLGHDNEVAYGIPVRRRSQSHHGAHARPRFPDARETQNPRDGRLVGVTVTAGC